MTQMINGPAPNEPKPPAPPKPPKPPKRQPNSDLIQEALQLHKRMTDLVLVHALLAKEPIRVQVTINDRYEVTSLERDYPKAVRG